MTRPASARRIRVEVKRWQHLLGLGAWSIKVAVGPIAGGHRATAEVRPEYREAVLSFDPVAMAQHEDSLVDTVIHEICHVINWRLAKLAEDLAGKNAFKQERVREAMEDVTTFAQHTVAHLARMAAQTPPPRRGG